MALIKCSECGKEISDKACNCPNCGHPLNNKSNEKYNKRVIISAIITVLFLGVVGGFFLLRNKTHKLLELNEKEKYALECLEKIYNVLKNPESMQVHSIEWIDNNNNENLEDDYYYIELSAQNGFGGMMRDSYIFLYSEYWSYKFDVEGKDLHNDVPLSIILGISYQLEGKGEKLDVDKIMDVFNATH